MHASDRPEDVFNFLIPYQFPKYKLVFVGKKKINTQNKNLNEIIHLHFTLVNCIL